MEHLHRRLDALEQRTHTLTRQLRWWCGLAGGLLVLAVLTWALPAGTAPDDKDKKGLEQRVAALESLLKHFSRKGNEVFIKRANLHIVNGLGSTDCTDTEGNEIPDCPNGLGNLIVGYNEPRGENDVRTGSHNVVVGQKHNFSSFGGLVVGEENEISGRFASVSGGSSSVASGDWSSVSGGLASIASGDGASVSGGINNTASGGTSSVSGGDENTASGPRSWVSGGFKNIARELRSSVSGGIGNTASGHISSVSGGRNRTAEGDFDWVAGSLFEDE